MDLITAINTIVYLLMHPLLYITLLLYDIDAKNLKRWKILHYALLLCYCNFYILCVFYDAGAGTLATYFLLACMVNLIAIALIKNYIFPRQDISLKREWFLLFAWLRLGIVLFIFNIMEKTINDFSMPLLLWQIVLICLFGSHCVFNNQVFTED